MNEMHSTLDRLEARIAYQTERIDALYAILRARGILSSAPRSAGDALFDELVQIEDAPLARKARVERRPRRARRLHVGEATGV